MKRTRRSRTPQLALSNDVLGLLNAAWLAVLVVTLCVLTVAL
jgi:hypothetical protein